MSVAERLQHIQDLCMRGAECATLEAALKAKSKKSFDQDAQAIEVWLKCVSTLQTLIDNPSARIVGVDTRVIEQASKLISDKCNACFTEAKNTEDPWKANAWYSEACDWTLALIEWNKLAW